MKALLAFLSLVVGWLAAVTSTFIWVGYSIYELVKTNQGFFEIVIPNAGCWLLQIVIGVILISLASALANK